MEPFLGIVVAMPAEGRALLGLAGWTTDRTLQVRRRDLPDGVPAVVVCSGVGGRKAARAARRLVVEGAAALAVAGVAGGLDPSLRPGDLLVADRIIDRLGDDPAAPWPADAGAVESVHARLAAEGLPARRGALITVAQPVVSPDDKRRLHAETGALAVDMETAAVARAASEARIPLLVLRSISDAADSPIPAAFIESLDDDGEIRPAVLLGKFLRTPSLVVSALRAGRDHAAGLDSLGRAWRSGAVSRVIPRLLAGGGAADRKPG